jgi:hydroxyacyl-ACP dehydratase HTD2-like protein with hotdog domain
MSLVKQWANTIKNTQWNSIDTISAGNTTHLYNLLLSIISVPCFNRTPQHLFFTGFHFLYNNQPNINVAADGYDNYQAPVDDTGKELFTRRLWVKGCVNFFPRSDQYSSTIKCSERIHNVRVMKESTFVKIRPGHFQIKYLMS